MTRSRNLRRQRRRPRDNGRRGTPLAEPGWARALMQAAGCSAAATLAATAVDAAANLFKLR